ncbi:MAG: hypothetical protein C5B59_04750 [Bacteroidetes bacterium]|nr:MAG: hypothetical protein C5B59_04750 [Bacteroidota bacterium]
MKIISRYLFALSIILTNFFQSAKSQVDSIQRAQDSTKRYRIALFLPLYLDSAFDAGYNYRYDKNFPKFFNPGLEFYEGAQLAIDSLQSKNLNLDVEVYDTHSGNQTISQIGESPDFQQTQLMVGYVNAAELRDLANLALRKNIPFINANYPNDGGITNNHQLVILNSTLRTHCEAIYKFVQRNYPTYNLLFFTKKGEDRVKNYFMDVERNTASVPLRLKYVTLDQPSAQNQILSSLDSSRKNLCIVGILDDNFSKTVCTTIASVNKTYISKIIGMPTWDAIDFSRPEFTDQEIYFTTPFYINPNDSLVISIQQYFKNKFYSRPSDMVFRGYEVMFRFSQLLALFGTNLSGSIGERKFKVFNDFDIQPVFLNRQNPTLDYLENKKLYFLKKVNGNIVAVY